MSSPFQSSSNYATHGSVALDDSTHGSTPTSSTAEQQELSIIRTAAYVADSAASHVQTRYKSAKQSKAAHTSGIKAYLDDFDAVMAMATQK
ncbi:hypothetical protein V8E51_019027 [Hyaloscypha variabilis]